MKFKKAFIFLFVLIIFPAITLNVSAEETTDKISSSIEDELKDFESSLPDSVKDILPDGIFDMDIRDFKASDISPKTFIDSAIDHLFAYIPDILNSVSLILMAIIISSVFNNVSDSLEAHSLKDAYGFCSSLCISLTVFNFLGTLCVTSIAYMKELCGVMTAFAPLMTAIQLISGKISTAALGNASFTMFIALIENVLIVFTVPIVKACFCFLLVKTVSGEKDIGGFIRLIKNTFLTLTGFTMMIFSFVFSFQNVLTQSADSLSMKTARFAIGSFIPIVGHSISDALSTVTSSISFIKNTCGIIALIAIVVITLPVIISVYLNKLCMDLCASLAGIIGCEREKSMLADASGIISFMLALILYTCVFFIYALTVFIKTSVGVT